MKLTVIRIISVILFFLTFFSTFAHAADKVVVIPLNSSRQGSPDKLWGEGRSNSTTLVHDTGTKNGYCTTGRGINYALSKHMTDWGNAQAVCPKDTWVCSEAELKHHYCPITLDMSYIGIGCDGEFLPENPGTQTVIVGWLEGAHNQFSESGVTKISSLPNEGSGLTCGSLRVWCCWK